MSLAQLPAELKQHRASRLGRSQRWPPPRNTTLQRRQHQRLCVYSHNRGAQCRAQGRIQHGLLLHIRATVRRNLHVVCAECHPRGKSRAPQAMAKDPLQKCTGSNFPWLVNLTHDCCESARRGPTVYGIKVCPRGAGNDASTDAASCKNDASNARKYNTWIVANQWHNNSFPCCARGPLGEPQQRRRSMAPRHRDQLLRNPIGSRMFRRKPSMVSLRACQRLGMQRAFDPTMLGSPRAKTLSPELCPTTKNIGTHRGGEGRET